MSIIQHRKKLKVFGPYLWACDQYLMNWVISMFPMRSFAIAKAVSPDRPSLAFINLSEMGNVVVYAPQ